MSLCHKFSFCKTQIGCQVLDNLFGKTYIFSTLWCKLLIFQTYIIWSNYSIHSLKLRTTTLDCSDIEIRKSDFVAKTQFLYFLEECFKKVIIPCFCHEDKNKLFSLYIVYKVVVGVDLINELLRKSGLPLIYVKACLRRGI